MSTAITIFNDEVTKFTRTIILETISKWLRANKGLDVSVDELSTALNMEFRVTPNMAASSVITQAPKPSRTKAVTCSMDLDPNVPCEYAPMKGNNKGIKCGKPSVKGTNYCPSCSKKSAVKKKNEQIGGDTLSRGPLSLNQLHAPQQFQPIGMVKVPDEMKFKQQIMQSVEQNRPTNSFNLPGPIKIQSTSQHLSPKSNIIQPPSQLLSQPQISKLSVGFPTTGLPLTQPLLNSTMLPQLSTFPKSKETGPDLIKYGDKFKDAETDLIVVQENGMFAAVAREKMGKEEPLNEDDIKLAKSKGFHISLNHKSPIVANSIGNGMSPINTDMIDMTDPFNQ